MSVFDPDRFLGYSEQESRGRQGVQHLRSLGGDAYVCMIPEEHLVIEEPEDEVDRAEWESVCQLYPPDILHMWCRLEHPDDWWKEKEEFSTPGYPMAARALPFWIEWHKKLKMERRT